MAHSTAGDYPARKQALTVRYGLYRDKSGDPAAAYYTRFAASRKCKELNSQDPQQPWFIRELE